MSAPARRAAATATIIIPRLLETSLVPSCISFSSFLTSQHSRARRDLGRVGQVTNGVAGPLRVPRDVFDEVAGDVALRHGRRARAWIAVPANDVERGEVDHRNDVVAATGERTERRDDQRHDPRVVLAVVRPVDRCSTSVGPAENSLLHPLIDLTDRATGLGLHALPGFGSAP